MNPRAERACDTLANAVVSSTLNALVKLGESRVRALSECDLDRLTAIVRSKMKERLDGLLADLRESKEAFLGNESMLRLTLSVGCMEIAKDAWVEFDKTKG